MSKITDTIKNELREALFPTLFFFITFHIVAATKMLFLDYYSMTPLGVGIATVGALTVAKAVLIADKMSLTKLFAGKPLVFGIVWKTAIFGMLTLVFRFIEELIPLWSKYGSFDMAAKHLVDEVSWPHFWAIQIWLLVALILYNAIAELDTHFGTGNMRKALLG